jgi:ATP-binding cassette subfamily C protein
MGGVEMTGILVTDDRVERVDDNETEMSRLKIVVRLLGMVKPVRRYMMMAISLGVLSHLANIAMITWGAYLITSIVLLRSPSMTLLDIALLFLFGFLRATSSYVEQNKNHDVAFRLLAHLRTEFYKNLEPLAPAKLMDKRSGNMTSTVGGDVELIEVFFAHTISPVSIAFVVSAVVLVFIGTWWTILPLVLLPFLIILGIVIPLGWERFIRSSGHQIREAMGEFNAHLTDSLQGLKTILLFNHGETRRQEIAHKGHRLNRIKGKNASYEGLLFGVIGAVILLANVIMIIVAAEGFLSGYLTIQGFIIVVAVTFSSFGPVSAVSGIAHHLAQTFAAAERLFKIMDEEPAVIDTPDCSSEIPPTFDMEFKEVAFAYSEEGPLILKDFSLRIPQNTTVALVGESGCGKSTVLRLLMRFWELGSGEILIGGTNIRTMCLENLHRMISIVSHDAHLFDTTIKENIAIGNPDATMEQIIECAKRASIHEFIGTLPRGYDTPVGELGDKLSGGERQRIVISRALLRNTPIILLDEPTSFLDSLNENAIQDTLNKMAEAKTVVLVTHRLSSLARVDKVYLMEASQCQDIQSNPEVPLGDRSHRANLRDALLRLSNEPSSLAESSRRQADRAN